MPYREASKLVERYFGQSLSHVSCQKVTNEQLGKFRNIEFRELKSKKKTPKEERRITFLVDGGTARTRIDSAPVKTLKTIQNAITKNGGQRKTSILPENILREHVQQLNPWRETKTWIITNGSDTVQWTTVGNHEEFMLNFAKEIKAKGYDTAPYKLSLNCDGAPWIGNDFEKYFPEIIQVLDIYHFKEHFYAAAKLIFKDSAQQNLWVKDCLGLCFEDKIAHLVLKVQNLMMEQKEDSKAKDELRKLVEYIKNNCERIRYGYFEELGYPLGSGEVEGAIKKMNSNRIKGASIRWREGNLKKILALRSIVFNDQYDNIKFA